MTLGITGSNGKQTGDGPEPSEISGRNATPWTARRAQEAGAPGWLGESDKSVPLLPFPSVPVRQEGARTGLSSASKSGATL